MTRQRTAFLTAALLIAALAVVFSLSRPVISQAQETPKPAANKAPDFTLTNYDGKQVSLTGLRGKIVVLEWLNYDCPFVKYHYDTEHTMIDLAKKYADKDVVWLGINTTHYATAETNKAFAEKHAVSYPILDDHKGDVGHAYGATNTPDMFVIDKDGLIVYQGAIDNAPFGKLTEGQTEKINYVDKALTELLEGKQISIPKIKPYGCTVKYAK
jgi:peroxiredoxin